MHLQGQLKCTCPPSVTRVVVLTFCNGVPCTISVLVKQKTIS